MDQLLGILLNVFFFAAIAGMFVLVIRMFISSNKEDKRIRQGWSELGRFTAEHGWTHEQRARGQATRYCGVGPMPGSGSGLSAWHHITGEFRDRAFASFEYRAVNASGDLGEGKKRPIIHTLLMVSVPGSGPATEILQPSKLNVLLDRRPSMRLGIPEFDEKFRVVTGDEAWVRNLLSDSVVSFLLTDPRAKRFELELRQDELFTWYKGTLSPHALEEGLNYLCDVLDRIPTQAWTAA